MRARFRIRGKSGRELSPATLGIFAGLVKAGEISPADLIYDALTGEWAPARAHPVYRMVEECVVRPEDEQTPTFSLARAPLAPTPAEEEMAFLAQLEREGLSEPDHRPKLGDVPLVAGGSEVNAELFDPPEPTPAVPARPDRSMARHRTGLARPVPRQREPLRRTVEVRERPEQPRTGGRTTWMLGAFALLAFVIAGLDQLPLPLAESATARSVTLPARVPRSVSDRERAARARAEEGVAIRVSALFDEAQAGDIPPVWLDGAYLAQAEDHPMIRETWVRYLAAISAARAQDVEMYRQAYVEGLEEEGVQGALRTMRVGAALLDFDARRPARELAYAQAEELAAAALSLHDVLVHLSGSITYEPFDVNGLSADPVLEAAGRDEETQRLLEKALDRVLLALSHTGRGPLELDAIPIWVRQTVGGAMPH